MESFCKAHYDCQIFHTIVEGKDASQEILDNAYQLLTDSEPSFSKVDHALFEREMAAMHLELFALAFLYRLHNYERAIQHSIFTLQYLENKGRSDIWEAMGEYGKVIARTATMDANGQQMSGDTAIGRMTITRMNEYRFQLFKDEVKSRIGKIDNLNENERKIATCVAGVCNRVEADIMRNKQIGNRSIAALFLSRLGVDNIWGKDWLPSEDFFIKVASQSLSMYEFSTQTLKIVDLQFS